MVIYYIKHRSPREDASVSGWPCMVSKFICPYLVNILSLFGIHVLSILDPIWLSFWVPLLPVTAKPNPKVRSLDWL